MLSKLASLPDVKTVDAVLEGKEANANKVSHYTF